MALWHICPLIVLCCLNIFKIIYQSIINISTHDYMIHITSNRLLCSLKTINTCPQLSWLFVADTASLLETDHHCFLLFLPVLGFKCSLIINTLNPFQVFNNGAIHFTFPWQIHAINLLLGWAWYCSNILNWLCAHCASLKLFC